MKRILFIVLFLVVLTIMTGCEKQNKTATCKISDGNTDKVVTIIRQDGKVIVRTDETKEDCMGEICGFVTDSQEETADDFDKELEKYEKEGYTCE